MNIITVIEDSIAINIGHNIIRKLAITFQARLIGIILPYQVVVIVTIAHQNVSGIELKATAFHQACSTKYTSVEKTVRIISITNIAARYSTLCLLIHLKSLVTIGNLSINSNILNTLNILNNAKIEYEPTP